MMPEPKLTKAQERILTSIYLTTECSNGVWEYATLHHKQQHLADALESHTLVEHVDDVLEVDGDGFVIYPERYGRGHRLTDAGRAWLAARDAENGADHE